MSAPSYWDYLRIADLLNLQGGLEDDEGTLMPDELHFIIVHQVTELWFKMSLRELRLARDHLAAPTVAEETVPYVVHHLRRISEILKLLVDQFAVMETLTPQDFLAFRDKLIPASGFQSFQMRELEMVLGLEDDKRISYAGMDPLDHFRRMADDSPAGALAWKSVCAAREEGTLKSALHEWLFRTPVQGSNPQDPGDAEAIDRFLESYYAALQRVNAAKQQALTQTLQTKPDA